MGKFKKNNRDKRKQAERHKNGVSKLFTRYAKDHPQTIAYFRRVERDTYDPEIFQANWQKMSELDLSPDDLTTALGAAARLLGGRTLNSRCPEQSLAQKGKLKTFLDSNFEIWLSKMRAAGLDTFDRVGLAKMIWDLGGINIWPGEKFMDQWKNAAEKFLSDDAPKRFRDSDLSKIMHGLCTIDAQINNIDLKNLIAELAQAWERIDDPKDFTVQGYFDACLWVGRDPEVKILNYSDHSKSTSEEKLRRLVGKIQDVTLYPEEGDNNPDNHVISSHPVDIPFEWREHKILLEFDGPTHFIRPPATYDDNHQNVVFNGATAFRTNLLSQCNPDAYVIRFPFSENDWLKKNCPSNKDKIFVLECMLHDLIDLDPGCYVATSQSGELGIRPLSTKPAIVKEPVAERSASYA